MTAREASKVKKMESQLQQLSRQVEDLQLYIKENKKQSSKQTRRIENLKQKNQELKKTLKKKDPELKCLIPQTRIKRHKYNTMVVGLCMELCTKCNLSFRSISKILDILDAYFGLNLASIPCPNTIENWMKKSGYKAYHTQDERKKKHALIIDESMMLGNEKLMMVLKVDAEKGKEVALRKQDVSVVNISVASSWNSTGVKQIFKEIEEKVGSSPLYVVSDNDTKLRKSIREMGYTHIRDAGHSIALMLEQAYAKTGRFKGFIKSLSSVKVREVMRPTSYLLPPVQRSIARFMNLSDIIKWSKQIIKIFPQLNETEKQVFNFVKINRNMINELNIVFRTVNNILTILKIKGLSKNTISACTAMLQTDMNVKDKGAVKVREAIKKYLEEGELKLKDDKSCWNASSDIIESMFGTYKFRRSKNRLNGITAYVLLLPLLTRIGGLHERPNIDFKDALESVFMKDLKTWTKNNLTENLAVKRKIKLAG
jgi:hypothetical protein